MPHSVHAQAVIERERRGDYLGKTVQVVPHITDAIQDWIQRVAALPVDGRPGPPCSTTSNLFYGWYRSTPMPSRTGSSAWLPCQNIAGQVRPAALLDQSWSWG